MLVRIVYRLLERGASSPYDRSLLDDFFQTLYSSDSAVELYDVDLLEAISECAVDDAIDILKTLCRYRT